MKHFKLLLFSLLTIMIISVFAGCSQSGEKAYIYDPGDYFITNVASSKSLLKSDITIELSSKHTFKQFEENQNKVRDTIVNVLKNKTFEQITASDSLNSLKQEIADALRKNLSVDGVKDIYFNEFVVQQ